MKVFYVSIAAQVIVVLYELMLFGWAIAHKRPAATILEQHSADRAA
jgi:hypothetical protein